MPLKTSHELTDATVRLIMQFKTGEVKPIKTGIDHLDEALLGGLLPGTVVGIVGRSGHGKSYDSETIQEEVLKDPEVIFANCNWELSHFKLLVRSLSKNSGQNVKQVLFDPLTDETKEKFGEICNKHRTDRLVYQNEPVTAEVFNEDIEELIKQYPTKKIVVSIDNLENILNSAGSQKASMDLLLSKVNRLKNQHWFISFIVLNQMNQDYLMRMDDIKKQRPIESDVYGSDQLTKLCDVLYIKMIPWKLGIREKFMVFRRDMYPWLDEFKINSDSGKTASFECYGMAYYFYLKLRQPEDEKNVKDIFATRMYERKESKYAPVSSKPKEEKTQEPVFTQDEEVKIADAAVTEMFPQAFNLPANFNMAAAFGEAEPPESDLPF